VIFDFTNLKSHVNDVYWSLFENKERYLILYGGAGSGKSYFAAQKILIRMMVAQKHNYRHRFLCTRKTQPAVRDSVFKLLSKYIYDWGMNDLVKVNKSEMTFTWPNGSDILCKGLDEPEKIKSIEGVTGEWLEEATELTPWDFRQLDLRLRGNTHSYKQVILTFNPIDKLNWVYQEFFSQQKPNTTAVRTTYKDNRFIDAEYCKVLENLVNEDEHYYQIYALGEWGVLQNIIYKNWDTVTEYPAAPDETIYGLDFGFNNPTALVEIAWRDNEPYIRERIYRNKMTNLDLIDELKIINPLKEGVIYADCEDPARIEEIGRAGFNVQPSIKGKGSIKNGIDCCKRYKLHLHSDSTNMINEIQGYKWKEDKDGNVLEEPVKFKDHGMDAMRYAMYTHELSKGNVPTVMFI
jgi:phage terminase large subunit